MPNMIKHKEKRVILDEPLQKFEGISYFPK